MSRQPSVDPVLLPAVAVAASVGGALAVGLLELIGSYDIGKLAIVSAIAAVVLSVLAAAVFPSDPNAEPSPSSSTDPRPGAGAAPASAPKPSCAVTGVPPESASPASVALRASDGSRRTAISARAGGSRDRLAGKAGASETTAEPSASTGSTQVVQCPRCGNFGVDAHRQDSRLIFSCQRCAHPWQWSPGSPGPVTVVRPRSENGRSRSSRAAAGPA